MTDDTVRSGLNDPLIELSGNRAGPQSAEMNTRPPTKRQPGGSQTEQCPAQWLGNAPEPADGSMLVGVDSQQKVKADERNNPVQGLRSKIGPTRGPVSPKSGYDPRNKPSVPKIEDRSL